MPISGVLTAKHSLAVLLLVLVSASPSACYAAGQNITAILAAFPDLGDFSSLLKSERLADDIYKHSDGPITVLAVNDTGMTRVKTMPREAIWGHLSLHVLLDVYYDDAQLQRLPIGNSTLVSTVYHAAGGGARGVFGKVRIVKFSDARGVGFLPMAGEAEGDGVGKPAFFVKSLYEAPHSISVLQVSGVMSTATTEAAQHY